VLSFFYFYPVLERAIRLVLNKIIDQLLHNRLYSFLNHNNFFYKFQYGFRSKSSTGTATVELVDKILNALDKGEVVTGIFLDLAKAFDTKF